MDKHSKDKKYTPIPHHVYKKSLNAFRNGYEDMKKPKPRNRVAIFAGVSASCLAIILVFAFLPTLNNQDNSADSIESESEKNEELQIIDLNEIEINQDVLSNFLIRKPFDAGESAYSQSIYNSELEIMALSNWSVIEEEITHGSKTLIEGSSGINQTIFIFDDEATQDQINQAKVEVLSDHMYTEATIVPNNQLTSYLENHPITETEITLGFKERFAINLDEHTKFITMINEPEGRLYDYVEATLFDKTLIFFSDVPISQENQMAAAYYSLSSMTPAEDYEVSKGLYDSKYGRPTNLTMLMGGFEWDFVNFDLYEHELGFTSYVREGVSLEKIERDGFTEWKFLDENTAGNYSFGKIDPAISLEDIKITLFNGYGLDPKEISDSSQILFSHREKPDTNEEIQRTFELVQKQGEWYYIYTESNNNVTNLGPSLWGLVNKFQQEIIFE